MAELIARRGLEANPKDPGLLNNLVNALANLGQIDSAEKFFRKITVEDAPLNTKITLAATEGLLHFRRGRIEQGRSSYKAVMDWARKEHQPTLAVRALAHLTREEILAGSETAHDGLAELVAIEGFGEKYPDLVPLLNELTGLVADADQQAKPGARSDLTKSEE